MILPVLAGQTVILPGSIKLRIREPGRRKLGSSLFQGESILGLTATIPGLNRRLKYLDYSTSFNIQYPLELQSPDFLRTMAQGSENKISMKIRNKSSQRICGGNMRETSIRISIPAETGSLRSSPPSIVDIPSHKRVRPH